jgi:hypothetical protein
MCDTFMNFLVKWKNIFLNNYTFQEAFDKYGISKDLKIIFTPTNRYCHIKRFLRNYISVASLNRFCFWSSLVPARLSFESRIHPFIVIKMYEISY